jgi:cytoskeletal protein RodZ
MSTYTGERCCPHPAKQGGPEMQAYHRCDRSARLVLLRLSVLLQMLAAPLFCLLAATAEATEARQLLSALRAAPPQLVVRSSSATTNNHTAAQSQPVLQTTHTASSRSQVSPSPAQPPLPAAAADVGTRANISTQPTELPGHITRSASATEAAIATSVAAFSPQLSVPLTLGLSYTNSGLLTAVCLFWVAVLWPR